MGFHLREEYDQRRSEMVALYFGGGGHTFDDLAEDAAVVLLALLA
jgi:hypothetical protein